MEKRGEGGYAPELGPIANIAIWVSTNYTSHVVIVMFQNARIVGSSFFGKFEDEWCW